MPKYAIFRKSDVQIHSCRDPGWQGLRAHGLGDELAAGGHATLQDVTAERELWAASLVDRCVAEKLGAIAITDHHEMVMVHYVLREVEKRKAADPNFDLWVFPGMELTFQGRAQCIILFDANLPPNWCVQAQGSLGIAHAAINENAHQGANVVQLNYQYTEVPEKLDAIPELRGRYIVLPNVSEGGANTVVKNGDHKPFREMTYIGGYVDAGQNIGTMRAGHRTRLSGKDKAWGARFIYPLPTSDSREFGYPRLGTNNAWIKLSNPTAESIRQAFLAWQSRISIAEPTYAALVVKSISVKGANPLADASLDLSPEFNTIIGGRGSGKSTLLEYIAFGLGRSCYDLPDKQYSGISRLADLVRDTVIAEGAEISLVVSQDGADFGIVRGPVNAYQPEITYPNGKKEILTARDLRSLFPAFAYSQGELSELGRSVGSDASMGDLLSFVRAPFKNEADKIEELIAAAKNSIAAVLRKFVRFWSLTSERAKSENRLNAALARVAALQATLPKLEDGEQAILDKHQPILEAVRQVARLEGGVKGLKDIVANFKSEIASLQNLSAALNDPEFDALKATREDVIANLNASIGSLEASVEAAQQVMLKPVEAFKGLEARHTAEYDGVVAKIGAQRSTATQISELQATAEGERDKVQELDKQLSQIGDLASEFRQSRENFRALSEQQVAKLKEWTKKIEEISDGTIAVNVGEAADWSDIYSALEIVATRTRSQEAYRTRRFSELAGQQGVWQTLDNILAELIGLLRWRMGVFDGEQRARPAVPLLSSLLGDSESIVDALSELMDETRLVIFGQAAARPKVEFKYRSDGREIAFEKASEGQRAAVLLTMLMKQDGGPLLVDQPEGDLDNRVITKVVELLHSMKRRRQLVIATHNANLVVNGAAENVVHMSNDDDGQRVVECDGAIDDPNIRIVITKTMEGGEEAFKDRQRKYGF